jgi:hypothetical protein
VYSNTKSPTLSLLLPVWDVMQTCLSREVASASTCEDEAGSEDDGDPENSRESRSRSETPFL